MRSESGNVLVIVLTGFLLLAIGAAGYFFWRNQQFQKSPGSQFPAGSNNNLVTSPTSQIQDDLSNWKTYTNKLYDFSFQYPPGYQLQYESYPTLSFSIVSDYEANCPTDKITPGCGWDGKELGLIRVHFYKNVVEHDLLSWIKDNNYKSTDINKAPAYQNLAPVEIQSARGYSYQNPSYLGYGEYVWSFLNSDLNYVVEFHKRDSFSKEPLITKVINTFHFLNQQKLIPRPILVTTFDDCGKIEKYSEKDWYADFKRAMSDGDLDLGVVSEACVALDNSRLVFLKKGVYCEGPEAYQYDIISKTLEPATVDDKRRGCLAGVSEFGGRNGNVIHLTGFGGDAGCEATMYFDYDYTKNLVELKSEYDSCQQQPGEWHYY